MQLRLALNSWASCLSLPSAKITDISTTPNLRFFSISSFYLFIYIVAYALVSHVRTHCQIQGRQDLPWVFFPKSLYFKYKSLYLSHWSILNEFLYMEWVKDSTSFFACENQCANILYEETISYQMDDSLVKNRLVLGWKCGSNGSACLASMRPWV
jgi:hypothetical protein